MSSSDLTTGLPSSNTCNSLMIVSRCRVERPPTLLLWRGSTSISARPLSSPVLLTLTRGCAPRRQGRQVGAGGWQEPRSRDPGGLVVLPANTAQRTGQDRKKMPAGFEWQHLLSYCHTSIGQVDFLTYSFWNVSQCFTMQVSYYVILLQAIAHTELVGSNTSYKTSHHKKT